MRACLVLLTCLVWMQTSQGAEILMMTLGGTKSHKIPFLELSNGLIKRGHNITFISAFPADRVTPHLEEITPMGLVFYVRNFTNWDLLGARIRNEDPVPLADVYRYGFTACSSMLTDPEIQAFIHSKRHFDLVILDGAFPECGFGYVHQFKAPYMTLNTVGFYTNTIADAGSPAPYAVTPFFGKSFTDKMNILERFENAFYHMLTSTGRYFVLKYILPSIMSTHWPDMPSILETSKNNSFSLQLGHPTVTYSRPFLPNVAEIGCIHCKPSKPLPKDLEDFINGNGETGFIYVSMGSSVKATNMPEYLRLLFVKVFAQLPYRVLWKWEGGNGSMSDISSNVHLGRWLPQQDILGHRKMRAFVTHGGLLSLFETVYHAVPVVIMPVFCDQDANSVKAVEDGYAYKLDLQHMTAEKLLRAINKVTHDPRYRENAQKRSQLLRDEPQPPLATAVFWTEHVLRHRGAAHLQSSSKDMNIFVYYSFDLIVISFLALALVYMVLRRSSFLWTLLKAFTKPVHLPKLIKQH